MTEKAERKQRPRTVSGVLTEWAPALAKVTAEPTADNLDDLCSLLDALDAVVVRLWGTEGHDERRKLLTACRGAAHQANARVTAAGLAAAQEAARKAHATREARKAAES